MTDDTTKMDGPERSPDLLMAPPKRGMDVRRLNKKPLLFVLGGATAVALVLIFTLNAKAARKDGDVAVAEAADGRSGPSPARPEFLKDAQTSGAIGEGDGTLPPGVPSLMAGPEAGGPLPHGEAGAAMSGQGYQQVAYAGGGQAAWNPHSQAWDAYYQQRAAMAQARYKAADDARIGGSSVEVQNRQDRPQPQSGGQGAGSPGGGMMMAGGGPAAGIGRGGRQQGDDLNWQGDKRAFLAESGGRDPYAAGRIQSPVSPYEIKAGTVIPATLITGINSDLPGQLVAQVNRNVYDTATGRKLLIPQGARLVGEYNSSVSTGQSRVQVAWNRLIYPDGSSIDLGSMPGTDGAGYTGLRDRVNNHNVRRWGNAIMLSLFAAGVQISQPQATNGENVSNSQTAAAQLGQQLGQLGMEQSRRDMQIQPTLTIRPGATLSVAVTSDLILREWRR